MKSVVQRSKSQGKRLLRFLLPRRIAARANTPGDVNQAFAVGLDHLFLDGWIAAPKARIASVQLLTEGAATDIPFDAYLFARRDVSTALKGKIPAHLTPFGFRLLLHHSVKQGRCAKVRIRLDGGWVFEHPLPLDCTAWKPPAAVLRKLESVPASYGLTKSLPHQSEYRDKVLQPCRTALNSEFEAVVDGWCREEDGSLLVFGWIDDGGRLSGRLIEAAGGEPWHLGRYLRADVNSSHRLGMLLSCARAETSNGAPPAFEFRTARRDKLLARLGRDRRSTKPEQLRDTLVSILGSGLDADGGQADQMETITGVIERLHEESSRGTCVRETIELGSPAARPEVSLIIPVFENYELARPQLACLAADEFVRRQEIILVLDSPDSSDRFLPLLRRIHELYGLAARVLVMNRSAGFGEASNFGSGHARAPFFLFMNSDVFPDSKGWLEGMLEAAQQDSRTALLGARLLYPDDSIQHDGLFWHQPEGPDGMLANSHPGKGLGVGLAPPPGVARVCAVTAACMLAKADVFEALGRFDSGYLRGDFEDSDLCLRAMQAGYRVLCDRRHRIYHLEASSYPTGLRRALFKYNQTRHDLRWRSRILQLLKNGGAPDERTETSA